MKRVALLLAVLAVSAAAAVAQTLNVCVGNITYQFPAEQSGTMIFSDGDSLTIMNKTFDIADISRMTVDNTEVNDSTISVTYDGTAAQVTVAGPIAQYVTPEVNGAHVAIAQSSNLSQEITYRLTGTSGDGEFYMSGSYKATLLLDGLTLTNTTPVYSGAAIHIQNGKRIKVKVAEGTVNTLTDVQDGSQKGCLYIKGHAEFVQKGTLNLTARGNHGIKTGEYLTLKNADIHVLAAVGDGISCSQYMLVESGTVTIGGVGDNGIQCDLDGEATTGETADHTGEDSGNIYLEGGTFDITASAPAAKGIKAEGDMCITGGNLTVKTTGAGAWDEEEKEAKGACGLSSNGNMTISGGILSLTSTGSGGRGLKCSGMLTVTDGILDVVTKGALYYNNGKTEKTNYTNNTDNISSNYYSSPKGIKAGTKTGSGKSYTYSGGIEISGGTVTVSTSGRNGEGIESKNHLDITGGHITVNAYDDAINAAQNLTVSGGLVYARGSNNDGLDANGNCYIKGGVIYAIGASSPEVAIDANSEQQKKLYVTGGTIVAIGGLESGSSLTQKCYSTSSWRKSTWYALYNGDDLALAFQTPTSGGTTLVVSTSGTTTLKSGVTVTDGTSLFAGVAAVDAAVSGGSSVTLSQYTAQGGHGGGGGGGGGRPW